ncbi:hypothetical protein BV25DRAFT_1914014 [Artomyces pyxidatus]|uniref:Uncharacterized protein n=1 Tax=Artomyces pyxidatus TaxID=48021 RepID=A0ACB8T7K1_9AGAM|nr:hypothetical protein BV25DRAFT_1914014 [Artomyces pyxidatus]
MSVVEQRLVRVHNCFELAALALLYYDHVITFPDEVARIWSRPFSRPSFLFYLNRYIPFFGNIAVSLFTFSNLASTDKWHSYVSSFMLRPCTHSNDLDLAVAWEAQAVFDLLVVGLTIRKTLQTRERMGRRLSFTGGGLVDLVYRDGAIYFVVMALANLANILTFYLAHPLLKGVLSTFASCISITMMSRLMLNLYEAMSDPETAAGSTTLSMVFTTRIEAGTVTTLDDGDDGDDGGWTSTAAVPIALRRRTQGEDTLQSSEELHSIELVNIGRAV